jgi:hypothetical protein
MKIRISPFVDLDVFLIGLLVAKVHWTEKGWE